MRVYFPKKVLLMLVLSAWIGLSGRQVYRMWTQKQAPFRVEAGTYEKTPPVQFAIEKRKMGVESGYEVVAAETIFDENREEYRPPELEPEAKPKPEVKQINLHGKKIILSGILHIGDIKNALITNPKPRAPKKVVWVKEGMNLGGLIIEEIKDESVVILNRTEKIEILLYEEDKSKVLPKENTPRIIKAGTPVKPFLSPKKEKQESVKKKSFDPFAQ